MTHDFTLGWCERPMHSRFFALLLLISSTVGLVFAPAEASAEPPRTEVDWTRTVCSRGPDVAISRAQLLKGEAAITAAGVLPNPSLVLEHQLSLSGPAERETLLGVSVPLGLSGRRALLRDVARARQAQARADARATLFDAALAFRQAFVEASLAEGEAEILAQQQALLEALSRAMQGQRAGGEAAGYDLLRQRTEARMHQRVLESTIARAASLRRRLSFWVGEEVVLPKERVAALVADATRVSRLTVQNAESPRVQALKAAARASALEAEAARRRWFPDLDMFAGYRQVAVSDATGHGMAFRVAMPLTFLDHGQGEAANAEAEGALWRVSAQTLRARTNSETKANSEYLRVLMSQLGVTRELAVDARALQSAAQKLYEAGEATITELLEAFQSSEQACLSELQLAGEIAHARLALMRAASTHFDRALDHLCGSESP